MINRHMLEHRNDLRPYELEVLRFLSPLSHEYPKFGNWFSDKVVPGLIDGSRRLIAYERHNQLVGVGIAKSTILEKKICTVRIDPAYFGRGLGVRIFDDLLHWLDEDHPHLTVGEHNLPAFQRIFDWYGFRQSSTAVGLYLPNRTEVLFNEEATTRSIGPHVASQSLKLQTF